MTSLNTIASTTPIATASSPAMSATNNPTTVPTTRLPSCIGSQNTAYSQFGQRLIMRNVAASHRGMPRWRASHVATTTMINPTTERSSHDRFIEQRDVLEDRRADRGEL